MVSPTVPHSVRGAFAARPRARCNPERFGGSSRRPRWARAWADEAAARSEGPGGVEQPVLTDLRGNGAPIGACVEIDLRKPDDVRRPIDDCGVACIGWNAPPRFLPPGLHQRESGTCVSSWGSCCTMTGR
jgi:hypothetical protein